MKPKNYSMFILLGLTIASTVFAQAPYTQTQTEGVSELATFPSGLAFFSTLICGVVMILALHLLFTSLSIAGGISIIKPENSIRDRTTTHSSSEHMTSTIKKFNNVFGLWMLIVTSISFFVACWLSIEISRADNIYVAIIMALTIWAAAYLIITVLEAKVLSTAFGGIYNSASSILKGVSHGVKGFFEKSPETQAADTAAKIVDSVRNEIFGHVDIRKLRKELNSYIQQLRPPSARDIKNEISTLLSETEIHEYTDVDEIVRKFEQQSPNKHRAKSAANQFRSAFEEYKRQRQQGKDNVSAGLEAVMQATGKTSDEAQAKRQQLEEYLRSTDKKELQPEELKKRIETLFTRPKEGFAQIKESIGSMDKNTTVAILEQRQDISHEEAEKIADNIQQTLNTMRSLLGTGTQQASEQISGAKEKLELKLRNYLDSLEEPEFNYDDIKEDIKLLFHDPKAGADALINRLKSFDRDTLKKIISSRRDISEERAEQIVSRIEEARDDVINKAEQMKSKVQEKTRQAQELAAATVEETRENAMIAAWWAVGAACFAAFASILGAIFAFKTGF
ncbi:MAG TPA: hypothetical protein DCP47_03780 [Phycisphaerales bacterium]|nr:hypothetical protein [Phycisphaerales bacterium]